MGGAPSRAAYDSPPTLSAKLGSEKHCLMAFLSPTCGLCASLRPKLSQVCPACTVQVVSPKRNGPFSAYLLH